MTTSENALVQLVQVQHRLICELKQAVADLSAMVSEQSTDKLIADRHTVLRVSREIAARFDVPMSRLWRQDQGAMVGRRELIRRLQKAGWSTTRIAVACGTQPQHITTLMRRLPRGERD